MARPTKHNTTFEEKKEYIRTHKKIDPSKFNSIGEITQILDLLNAEKDAYLDTLIKDIAEENVKYGVIPQKYILEELDRRKKRHISSYLEEQKRLIKV
jgi:hypothetical protein